VNFNTAASTTFGGGTISAGTLAGTADVIFGGVLNWTSASMSGSGKTVIANTGSLSLPGTGFRTLSRTLQVASNGSVVMATKLPSISGAGKLDLTNNTMIVDYSGSSP